MKKILLLIAFIFFGNTAYSQKMLVERTKGSFKETGYLNADSLKVGEWKTFHKNGNVFKAENYKSGKLNGISKEYFITGQLQYVRTYKKGSYNGKIIEYYENGVKASEGTFKPKKTGKYKSYYRNGLLKEESKWDGTDYYVYKKTYYEDGRLLENASKDKNNNTIYEKFNRQGTVIDRFTLTYIDKDKKVQVQEKFYDSGKIKSQEKSESEGIETKLRLIKEFNEDGKLVQEKLLTGDNPYLKIYGDSINVIYNLVNYRKDGYFQAQYHNGQIAEKGFYRNDLRDGSWKSYYPDGTLKFTGKYIGQNPELKDSIHTYYYSNGKIHKTEYYDPTKSKTTLKFNHNKSGTWKTYYENGTLKEVVTYDNNHKQGSYFSYYEDGTIETEANYHIDFLNGTSKTYHRNSNIKEIVENYSFGAKNGLIKTYFDDGKLESETMYENGVKNGLIKLYYENGNKKLTGSYKYDERKNGIWEFYYLSGAKAQKIVYADDEEIFWFYYPSGQQMAELRRNPNETKHNQMDNIRIYSKLGKEITLEEFATLNNSNTVTFCAINYSTVLGHVWVTMEYENADGTKRKYEKIYE